MKRLAGYIILSAYLLSFTELHNLARIPVLLSHYHEHRQQESQLSFWSFLKLHYAAPQVMDDDYKRDRQLPFRDADCGHITSTCICEITPLTISLDPPVEESNKYQQVDEHSKPLTAAFDIFQPPRIYA